MKIKRNLLALSATIGSLLTAAPALAHCPLCSAATGSLLVVARAAGVSDLASGTLAGAFAVSTALWGSNWLKKRNKGKAYLPFQGIILVLASILLTIISLEALG